MMFRIGDGIVGTEWSTIGSSLRMRQGERILLVQCHEGRERENWSYRYIRSIRSITTFISWFIYLFIQSNSIVMSAYSDPASAHPYWYYDPHGYQPNVSMPGNGNTSGKGQEPSTGRLNISSTSAHTPVYPSFDMYSNHSSRLADSGYLSRTPTPPTPGRVASPPRSALLQQDSESNGIHLALHNLSSLRTSSL